MNPHVDKVSKNLFTDALKEDNMKLRKGVFFALLALGAVLGLSAANSPVSAAEYGGRPADRSPPGKAHLDHPAGQTYSTGYSYIGRRVDHPQAIFARRPVERAELARFEEGRPAAPRRAEYPYIGRRVDALR